MRKYHKMFRTLCSPLKGFHIVWIKCVISARLFLVLACDIEKTSYDSSKLVHLSCSCDGKPADSWSQLLSVAMSVSYADREDKLVSINSRSTVDQKSSNWTIQVTNSEFNGSEMKARLDVLIGISSRIGVVKFKCIFVGLDLNYKHQHQEKYVDLQVPVSYMPATSSLLKPLRATSTRAPFPPIVTTLSSRNSALAEKANANATWLTRTRSSVTSPVTEMPITKETSNSIVYLKEQSGASEGMDGHFNSHLILGFTCATLAVLGAFVVMGVVWLRTRWRRRRLRDLRLPEPHRPKRVTLSQELRVLSQLSDILSNSKRLPNDVHTTEETAHQRDSHIYASPYAVCMLKDSEHEDRTSEADTFHAIHSSTHVLSSCVDQCEEAAGNVSPKFSQMGQPQNNSINTLYLTPTPEVKKIQDLDLKEHCTSPYITACELHLCK